MGRLRDLILKYFKAEESNRRISREQFYSETARISGGRNSQNVLVGCINSERLVHFWCRRGDIDRLTELVGMHGVDLELDSEDGTPLCIAARLGHVEVADLLLEAGANLPKMPETPQECRGNPWFESCSAGMAAMFHLLLMARKERLPPPQAALNLLLEAAVSSAERGRSADSQAIARTLIELGASAATSGPTVAALRAGNSDLLAQLLAGGAVCDPREADQSEARDRTLRSALSLLMQRRKARPEIGAGAPTAPSDVVGLTDVRLAWIGPDCLPNPGAISELTMTECGLTCLPAALLHGLPRLRHLDVSRNCIACLEEDCKGAPPSRTLARLNLSQNQLTEVPHHVFAIESLLELNLAHNQLGQTAWHSTDWACKRLEVLNLSDNGIATLPPQLSQVCGRLVRLFASNNRLTTFPCWACKLEVLDLSSNSISDIPGHMSTLWQNSLRELRLSDNRLMAERSIVPMVSIATLSRLSLARNRLSTLPSAHLWRCVQLFELDLAGNQIEERVSEPPGGNRLPNLFTFRRPQVNYEYELEIPKQLTGLHRLILGGNRLHRVPPSVCELGMLETLDISGNPRISQIPLELGQCRQLMRLICDPAQVQEPLRHFVQKGFQSSLPLLNHLRLQLYKSEPYYHLKLIVAGNSPKDRLSLIRSLGFAQSPSDTTRSVYISSDQAVSESAGAQQHWSLDRAVTKYIQNADSSLKRVLRDTMLQPPAQIFHMQMTRRDMLEASRRGAKPRDGRLVSDDFPPRVHLHAWSLHSGFSGGAIGAAASPAFDSTHEIVLTKQTLYLLLWDCLDGRRAFEKIKQSLLTIQARAPSSSVIAIGQNLAPGDEWQIETMICDWRSKLESTPGYPPEVEFIVLPDRPDEQTAARLRWLVLERSLKVRCPDDAQRGFVIGRQLPLFFANAMEQVVQRFEAFQGSREAESYVPLITEDKMLELLKAAAVNCEVPSQAFEKAIDFMHELGLLLHIRGDFNPSLFCPDPEWFLFVLQSVIMFKSTAAPHRGELEIDQLKRFLTSEMKMPHSHIETFMHLFQDLNICHKLSDKM